MIKNPILITNEEFSYYKGLCNSENFDEQREGIQSIIREIASGRIIMNGHKDYIESQLPIWLLSPSKKVKMWSLWLSSLVSNCLIENLCIDSLCDEYDPQNISAVLAMLSTRYSKAEYLNKVHLIEKTLKAELNEDIINISSCLFSREKYYDVNKKFLESFLEKDGLLKWGSIWIPIFFAYPYLTSSRDLGGLITHEQVCELLNVNSPRVNEYALWCMSLNGNVKAKHLPINMYDYQKLPSNVLKWYFQIILKDPVVYCDISYIEQILNNIHQYNEDVKEGILCGIDLMPYHKEFVPHFVKWFYSETDFQIKRLLINKMLSYIHDDYNFGATYYEVLADEFKSNRKEKDIIYNYISMSDFKSDFCIASGKLEPIININLQWKQEDYKMDQCKKQTEQQVVIGNLQINYGSNNMQNNYQGGNVNDEQLAYKTLINEIQALKAFNLTKELNEKTKALEEEIECPSNSACFKEKLLEYSSYLANAITITGALPGFILVSTKIMGIISEIITKLH